MTDDPSQKEEDIQRYMNDQKQLSSRQKFYHNTYFLLICLADVVRVVFCGLDSANSFSPLSVPIAGLLEGAREVSRGNLSYRVRVGAIDELATLGARV